MACLHLSVLWLPAALPAALPSATPGVWKTTVVSAGLGGLSVQWRSLIYAIHNVSHWKYRRSGNFRCYNIFVNVGAYENLTHEYLAATAYLSRLFVGSRPNALVHVVAADTQLSFESLHRNFTPVKKNL